MTATLPLDDVSDLRCRAAPSTSPTRRSSGTPPAARTVAVEREPPGDLLGGFVVARQVVDHHDAAERARTERPREIGLDLVAAMASDRYGLGQHCVEFRHGGIFPTLPT